MNGGELVVVFLVAFLVFGPKKMPELARMLGKLMYEIREGMRNATVEIKKEYEEMEKRPEGGMDKPAEEGKTADGKPLSHHVDDGQSGER